MGQPPVTLLIEQTDGTVVLSENGLAIEVLIIGARHAETSQETAAESTANRRSDSVAASVEPEAPHRRAAWTGGQLLAERDDPRGGHASQRFAVSPDHKTLTLIVGREGRQGMRALELRRVYRRYEGD